MRGRRAEKSLAHRDSGTSIALSPLIMDAPAPLPAPTTELFDSARISAHVEELARTQSADNFRVTLPQ